MTARKPPSQVRVRRIGTAYRRETLGDLDGSNNRLFRNLVQSMKDGSTEQRCGGGVRIIRKRTPE